MTIVQHLAAWTVLLGTASGLLAADALAPGEEWHWGRDAGYFDVISGFTRHAVRNQVMARNGKAGSFVSSALDRTLPPGRYLVMVQMYSFGAGINAVEVELNGARADIRHDGAKVLREFMPAVVTTTQAGNQLKLTVKEVGQKEIRLYSVWVTNNLQDDGDWRRGITLGRRTDGAKDLPRNLLPGGSFETGLNDTWGKTVQSGVFINDDNVVRDDAAPHGARCLGLPWRRGPAAVTCPPVELRKGGALTLSLYARGERPCALAFSLKCQSFNDAKARSFTGSAAVETAWKRFSLRAELPEGFEGNVQPLITADPAKLLAEGQTPPALWIDAVQLERGEMTDYAPAYSSEAGLRVEGKPGSIFAPGERNELEVALAGASGEVEVAVMDSLWRPALRKTLRIETAKGLGHARLDVPLPAGAYMAEAHSLAQNAAPAVRKAFSIMPRPPDAMPFQDLRAGVYATITDESVASLRRAGLRCINTLSTNGDLSKVSMIAPAEGKYVWVDWKVDLARQAGIEVAMNLHPPFPAWMCEPGKAYPRIDAWERVVGDIARHYKGRVGHWMFVDEPSSSIPAEHFQKMMAAGCVAVKRVDADARVLMHGDLPEYFKKVVAAGGGGQEYYDVLMAGANNPESSTAQSEAARAAGKEVWAITFMSKSSLYDGRPAANSCARMVRAFAQDLSILRAVRYLQYTARVSGPSVFQDGLTESMYEFDGAFRPAGVAYAIAGQVLAGTKPLGPVKTPEGMTAHLFAKGDTHVTAVWSDGRMLSCRWTPPDGVRIMDMNGNGMTPAVRGEFSLDGRPVYLVGGASLADAISTVAVTEPVRVSASVVKLPDAGHDAIRIVVENSGDAAFEAQVTPEIRGGSWFVVEGNRRAIQQPRVVSVPARGKAFVDIPCLRHTTHPLKGYTIGVSVLGGPYATTLSDLAYE